MDTKENSYDQPAKKTYNSRQHHIIFSSVSLIILVIAVSLVYFWKQQEVNSLNTQLANASTAVNNQKAQVTDGDKALSSLPNRIEDVAHSPIDLIAFLGADNTQCYKQQNSGYFKVVSQANDQFAEMQYGCTTSGSATPSGTPTYILAKKVGDKWQLISPTDQWSFTITGKSVPSCKIVNDNKISMLVAPQCFAGDVSSPSIQQVANP